MIRRLTRVLLACVRQKLTRTRPQGAHAAALLHTHGDVLDRMAQRYALTPSAVLAAAQRNDSGLPGGGQ